MNPKHIRRGDILIRKVIISDFFYQQSESMSVLGKSDSVKKLYGGEWNISKKGKANANWLLTKPSKLWVEIDDKVFDFRFLVLDYYDKSNLTIKLFEKFKDELKNEKIAVFFDDNKYSITKIKKKKVE